MSVEKLRTFVHALDMVILDLIWVKRRRVSRQLITPAVDSFPDTSVVCAGTIAHYNALRCRCYV
jgi:hypothetical protein